MASFLTAQRKRVSESNQMRRMAPIPYLIEGRDSDAAAIKTTKKRPHASTLFSPHAFFAADSFPFYYRCPQKGSFSNVLSIITKFNLEMNLFAGCCREDGR